MIGEILMGKYIDTGPSSSYQRGGFKITRLNSTIYFYLQDGVVPYTKRDCGDDKSAIMWYNRIVNVIKNVERSEQKSLWDRIKRLWKF
jgi:hypothetical protein